MQILAKRLTRIICLRFHEAGFEKQGNNLRDSSIRHTSDRAPRNERLKFCNSVIVKVFYLFDTGNNSLCKKKHAS